MNIRDLLDSTYYHLRNAEAFSRKGDKVSAYAEFNKSAKHLLEAARISTGNMKKIRFENAEKLIAMADEIERENPELIGHRGASGTAESVQQTYEDLGVSVVENLGIRFDDVAGLDDVKEQVMNKVIYPLRNAELAKEYGISPGGGILLYGPPGTGKTFIAKAISTEVKARFISVNPSSLVSKWFGSYEKKIEQLFRLARESAPTVIFFDEIDAMAPRRAGNESPVMKRVVPQLLAELDGLNKDDSRMLLVIGATNNPWDLDDAIMRPGRFDSRIYVTPPDQEARRKIFELSLRGRKVGNTIDYDALASATDGYTGADITYICRVVSEKSFRAAVEDGEVRYISQDDLMQAIRETPKSVHMSMLEKYRSFGDDHQ